MLCTVQCRPAAACARKSPPRVHSKETRQDKTSSRSPRPSTGFPCAPRRLRGQNCVVKMEVQPGYAAKRADWENCWVALVSPTTLSCPSPKTVLLMGRRRLQTLEVKKTLKIRGFFLCRPPHGACGSCPALVFGWLCGRRVVGYERMGWVGGMSLDGCSAAKLKLDDLLPS
jgi:hypothetical protein